MRALSDELSVVEPLIHNVIIFLKDINRHVFAIYCKIFYKINQAVKWVNYMSINDKILIRF